MRVISLFSGIGSPESALKMLGIEPEVVFYSDIDEKASTAYSAIHNVPMSKNLGDITKINVNELDVGEIDLITWGFPCVNFSSARRDKENFSNGLENEHSGLYYNGLEIISKVKPKISIIENVPNLVNDKKFADQFKQILADLSAIGYTNSYAVLKASDYGIPQKRERVFIVSTLKTETYRFPSPIPLVKKMGDYLEEVVSDKFMTVNPVIHAEIMTKNVGKDICNTITKAVGRGGSSSEYISWCAQVYQNKGFIRRLTPRECYRLMGFTDTQYEKAASVVTDTALYCQAGNSIVVDVMYHIFKELIEQGFITQ